jgi:hypothetical protein
MLYDEGLGSEIALWEGSGTPSGEWLQLALKVFLPER